MFAAAYRRLTVGIVATVLFIAFEAMAVATIMPVAVEDLHGRDLYAWGFSAFLITSLVGMVVAGDVSDAHGPRLPLVASGLLFAAGLLVAGVAQHMSVFVAGRAVQGLGMGAAIVAIYVVVGRRYPDALRPRIFSVISSAWVLPSILGPAAAGWLADVASWRWVFLGVLPVIGPAMLLVLPATRGLGSAGSAALRRRGRTRLAIVAAVGVAALQYAGQHLVALSLAAAAVGAVLLWHSVPRLLPAGTLRAARGIPTTVLMRGVLAGAFFGAQAFVPLMLVQERGLRPGLAGLPLTGGALGWAGGSWFQGRPHTRIPRHRLVQLGCALVATSIVLVAVAAAPPITPWLAAVGWTVGGCGMGLAMSSIGVLVLEQSPVHDQGANSAALQLCDALLSTVFIGLGGVLFAALNSVPGQDGDVYMLIYAVMAALAVAGVLLAPRVRPPHRAHAADRRATTPARA